MEPTDETCCDRPLPKPCYLTRARHDGEYYFWNTSPDKLSLLAGDIFYTCIVTQDFSATAPRITRVDLDLFEIQGLGAKHCVIGRDVCFLEPTVDLLGTVATQEELEAVCMSRGIKCSDFLQHYVAHSGQDEELAVGSQVCALFIETVSEMLDRKYDIMHHYPLFSRALEIHYKSGNAKPPKPSQMLAEGGLLDQSAAQHESVHAIPLQGDDHVLFSKWNYSGNKHAQQEAVQCTTEDSREPRTSAESMDTKEQHFHAENVKTEMFIATTMARFNNLPGTLTDRPIGFPYWFTVCAGNPGMTFDDLVNYCLGHSREPLGDLPPRENWGSIAPVLLMEDPVDQQTGKTKRKYVIASRGDLTSMVKKQNDLRALPALPSYNEVFLPGRPVSRLNLDVDLKCCQKCNAKFSIEADMTVRRKICKALTASLVSVIVESLLRMANVTTKDLRDSPQLRRLSKRVGKIAVYFRVSRGKSKLSLRMLWYLPIELCSFGGIDVYKNLLNEMVQVSKRHTLLSYPGDSASCGLCDLKVKLMKRGRDSSGVGFLRIHSQDARASSRLSCIDAAPYSCRKSVRLPNCYKEETAFQYMDTYNTADISDPGVELPTSLAVGLSSNPILTDVTSLGDRFRDILKGQAEAKCSTLTALKKNTIDQGHVQSEAQRLRALWGVPVTIKENTKWGFYYIQADEKSTKYPCPLHNRVHSKAMLCALVFSTVTKPHCFVS